MSGVLVPKGRWGRRFGGIAAGLGCAAFLSWLGAHDSLRYAAKAQTIEVGPLPSETMPLPAAPLSDADTEAPPVTAGAAAAGRYLLVSSFQCNVSQPNCQNINAVLRYNANPGPLYGRFDGVHISNIPGPYGMAIHPVRNTLLVVSRHTHSVREYNRNTGAYLRDFVTAGDEGLHLPQYIVFKADGNLLVTSAPDQLAAEKFNGVLQFSGTTGEYIGPFVDGGYILEDTCPEPDFPDCLRGAAGMVMGANGNLYVASSLNHRVIEYNGVTGAYINKFDATKLESPNGLAVRPPGTIREGGLLITSTWQDPANPSDTTDKVVEFSLSTHELWTSATDMDGIFTSGLKDPGPILFDKYDVNDNIQNVLLSDRLFWYIPPPTGNYSDRIRIHNGSTGAFLGYFIQPTSDSHLHYNTGMIWVEIGCQNAAECDDGNPCTDDSCSAMNCTSVADNTNNPNDGLYCNGTESACVNGVVMYSQFAPNCNDGLTCTEDDCNEGLDACQNTLGDDKCLINGVCSNFGGANPQNGCLECNPVLNQFGWSPRPERTACGDQSNTECNNPNTCDAAGVCQNNLEAAGTACGSRTDDACTNPDTCNSAGTCVVNHAPNGTMCSDGLFCTSTDRCTNGVCGGTGNPCANDPNFPFCFEDEFGSACVECLANEDCDDDGLFCTRATCVPDTHECVHQPDDSRCDNGAFCDGPERCNGATGQCLAGADPCPGLAGCDEANDRCTPAVCTSNPQCSDNIFCNGVEICQAGTCVPGAPVNCAGMNTACRVGVCNEAADMCTTLPGNEGGVCNDNNMCTGNDRCASGTCVGQGPPPNCDDGNACTTDSCAPASGCQHVNNTGACSDGNPCTTNDTCSGGACVGGPPIDCGDGNLCTTDSCHPVLGCRHVNNSVPCNDNSVCTTNDQCSGGQCGGTAVNCNDGNPCTTDTCDAVMGCRSQNNTLTCNDGDACTVDDRCSSGSCAGVPIQCATGLECDPADGACRNCRPNFDCGDGNPCTDDSCLTGFGCVHLSNNAPCNDSKACTTGDICDRGVCAGAPPSHCVDGDECTLDSCNDQTGQCVNEQLCMLYGDVRPPAGNCLVDVDDLICVLDGFAHHSLCPQADIFPCEGNGDIDLDDILSILETLEGRPTCADGCSP